MNSGIKELERGIFLLKQIRYVTHPSEDGELSVEDFWHAVDHLLYARSLLIGKEIYCKCNDSTYFGSNACPCKMTCCDEYHQDIYKMYEKLQKENNG